MFRSHILTTTVLCCLGAASSGQGVFFALGDLPGGSFRSHSSRLSGNGTTVVGGSDVYGGFTGEQAFRWRESTGMVNLGNLPAPYFESDARGVSYSGEFVVGGSSSNNGREAFLWSESAGMIGLGDLPGQDFASNAHGVSADGRVVVGWSDSAENFDGGHQAFRWTPQTGMTGLGFLPGGRFASSYAMDVSNNGDVIVGRSTSSTGTQGFRWTEQIGMVPLASLPGSLDDFNHAAVLDISPNGKYISGSDINGDFKIEAVLWTPNGEAKGLGHLPGDSNPIQTTAVNVSNDGRVVVGHGQNEGDYTRGFVWTPDTGIKLIEDVLRNNGLDDVADGWFIGAASGVSADGHWITGFGVNPDGYQEAWLAYLPTIPTPNSLAPLAAMSLFTTRRRRHCLPPCES